MEIESDLLFRLGARINGLLPALTNGQALTYEQLAGNSLYEGAIFLLITPAASTTISVIGTTITTAGTTSHGTPTAASFLSSSRRFTISGVATAGTVAYLRQNGLIAWRGNATNRGGFRFQQRFGLEQLVATNRAFFGLADSIANPTNVDPLTATIPGKIGLAVNANTGNWQLINNASGTAPTVLDLGSSFPVNATDLLELVLAALPNASSIDWVVTNRASGAIASGTLTTNIFSNTAFFSPLNWMSNNTTAAAFGFASQLIKLTTPN